MYSIQNLTKTTLKFQGIAIGPYMTISVGSIQDYVTLSRLSNSGKIRYFTTPTPKATTAVKKEVVTEPVLKIEPAKEEVKEEIKEEVIEKPVEETPIVEEAKEEIKEEPVESITEETTVKSNTRKKRSNKK